MLELLKKVHADPQKNPDLHLQQEAARRLGFESGEVSIYAFNAILMNRIADLEERLEAHEKAKRTSQENALGQSDPDR